VKPQPVCVRILQLTLLLALSFVALGTARASVIYSNLGSPPQFNPGNGWHLDGGALVGQMLAVAFTPSATVRVADAQLALGIVFTNLSQSPIVPYLALDAGGLPGTQLVGLTLASGQSIGAFPPGNLATFICSSPCPMVNAGQQYWLVVQIPNLGPDYFNSQAEWNFTYINYASGTDFAFRENGTGWQFNSSTDLRPAFAIDGSLGSSLPEPSSLLLLASGVLGVMGAARLRIGT
jgi:hypothetical protein